MIPTCNASLLSNPYVHFLLVWNVYICSVEVKITFYLNFMLMMMMNSKLAKPGDYILVPRGGRQLRCFYLQQTTSHTFFL